MPDLISVIVPVYKVEQYLSRCIESIVNQTYTNLEIILIDDGSPDRCGEICDEYAKKDRRVKVIHKENGGLSDARNAGIDAALGRYLMFVDSDDYIAFNMVQKLYDALITADADISICNFKYIWENKDEEDKSFNQDLPISDEVISGEEVLLHRFFEPKSWFWIVAWNKLYKRELFDNIRFPKGKIHEDEFVIHRLLYQCKKIAGVGETLYFYVQRKGSIMSERKKDFTSYLDRIEAYINRTDFLCEKGHFGAAQNWYEKIVYSICTRYREMLKHDEFTKKRVKTLTHQAQKYYFKMAKKTGIKDTILFGTFMISPALYGEYMRLRNRKELV